jgi:response regulator RpfG family c-di-GMP phosphodiesterase
LSRDPAEINKKVAGLLMKEGLLKPEQFEKVMQAVGGSTQRVEDVCIEQGLLQEADLLKALASHYKTRFVSSEKLAKADIPRATLELIPRRVAETFQVFPVLFDATAHVLSVVTADPGDKETLREIQLVSGAKEVRAFAARPAAVRAAIAKCYGGDIHAFAILDRKAHEQFSQMLDVYERNLMNEGQLATALARENVSRGRVVSEKELMRAARSATSSTKDGAVALGSDEFLELLNVMVSLLESTRQDLRGHSAQVARLTRRILERINVPPATMTALVAAALLHDVGKMGQYHLTALNVSEYDGHKLAAQKQHGTPARLLDAVHLPAETVQAMSGMYERYDGRGFPEGIAGKDIPLGARVLAITDTYADLTQNPRNPYRKTLPPGEACGVLAQFKDKIFDPHLVDLFKHMVMGEDLRAKLLANRYFVLLVDPDPEDTTVLELRMIEQGMEVRTARTAEQALRLLSAGDIDVVVSELDLPQGDGLSLLAEARKQPWGKDVLWVVHTRRQSRADAQRSFELGVVDFVAKPAPTDVFVAKLKAMLDQRASKGTARGVSGSLREMGLPELVQVLFHGRKTGSLRIRAQSSNGEIHFQDGQIVNALWGTIRGEEAFYAMLKLQDGEFGLDPTFKPGARVIQESPEALLLEGMRRLDEGLA